MLKAELYDEEVAAKDRSMGSFSCAIAGDMEQTAFPLTVLSPLLAGQSSLVFPVSGCQSVAQDAS